jgi:predicted cupin superfamily sugar epimerase
MNAQEVIQRWGLQPHPEGGYYRELYRSPTGGFFGVASGAAGG